MTLSSFWRIFINFGLIVIIGYQVVVWVSLESPKIPNYQAEILSSRVVTADVRALDVTPLINAHLFGEIMTPVSSNSELSPPETKLSLRLRGIFFAPLGNRSAIMVAEDKEKSVLYKLNAVLPGGAKVDEIREKEVILLRNGRYESLKLEGSQLPHIGNTEDSFSKTVVVDSKVDADVNNMIPPEQLLGQFQQQLQTDPVALSQLMKVSPVVEAGRFMGYQLSPGKNPALMSQFNLQAGDILTQINGITLDSPLKGLDALPTLASTDRVDLQILRNGQLLTFSFPVQH